MSDCGEGVRQKFSLPRIKRDESSVRDPTTGMLKQVPKSPLQQQWPRGSNDLGDGCDSRGIRKATLGVARGREGRLVVNVLHRNNTEQSSMAVNSSPYNAHPPAPPSAAAAGRVGSTLLSDESSTPTSAHVRCGMEKIGDANDEETAPQESSPYKRSQTEGNAVGTEPRHVSTTNSDSKPGGQIVPYNSQLLHDVAVPSLSEFVAMVQSGQDRVPLISSWPAANPKRRLPESVGGQPPATSSSPRGATATLGARPTLRSFSSRTTGLERLGKEPLTPARGAGGTHRFNSLSESHGKPKTEFVEDVEAFLARECTRLKPLNERIFNCCVALDEIGTMATTFVPLFEQIKNLVVDFGSQLGEVVAQRDEDLANAVDANSKAKDTFYQQCMLRVLGDKKRQTEKLKEAELAVADIQADREKQLTEAKEQVWAAVKKVHDDQSQEASMRQLVAAVYRTNDELREEVALLQQTIRSHGGDIPTTFNTTTCVESSTGMAIRAKSNQPGQSNQPGPGIVAPEPVRSLGNTVSAAFMHASKNELAKARLSTQRALIDAASETKSSYRSLLEHSKSENIELTDKVEALEHQVEALEKHIHNLRFNYEERIQMLPESEQEDARVRASTPRPSLPFDVQQKLGINLRLSSKGIAEELASCALRLNQENRDLLVRNRRLAINTTWMEKRIVSDNIEELGGYHHFIPTEKDDEWPTLHHYLRTNVGPSVPNENWSLTRTVQLVRLFFERYLPKRDEARSFHDNKCCAVPVVPQWERRRYGVVPFDLPQHPTGTTSSVSHIVAQRSSRPSSTDPEVADASTSPVSNSAPSAPSSLNSTAPSSPTRRFPQASNLSPLSEGSRDGTYGPRNEDIPVGYVMSCFLRDLLDAKYKSSEPEDSDDNLHAIRDSAPEIVARRQAQLASLPQYQRLQLNATRKLPVDDLLRATTAYNLIFSVKRYSAQEPLCQLLLKVLDAGLTWDLVETMDSLQARLFSRLEAADPGKCGVLTKRVVSTCLMSVVGNENTTVWRECLYALELMMKRLEAPKIQRGRSIAGDLGPNRALSVVAGGDSSVLEVGTLGLGGAEFYSNQRNTTERVSWKRLLHPDGELSIVLRQYVVQSYTRFNRLLILAIETSGTTHLESAKEPTDGGEPESVNIPSVSTSPQITRQTSSQPMVQESITKSGLLVVRVADLVRLGQRMDEVVDRKKEYLPPLENASFHELCQRVTSNLPRLNSSVHCPLPVKPTPASERTLSPHTATRNRRRVPKRPQGSSGKTTTLRLAEAKNDKELVEWYEVRHYLQVTKPGSLRPDPPILMTHAVSERPRSSPINV